MSSIKIEGKRIYKEIGRIASGLQAMPENEGMTRNELVAKAIDIYYSSREVKS